MVRLGELMMILDLHRQGLSPTAIARQLGIDRKFTGRFGLPPMPLRPGDCATAVALVIGFNDDAPQRRRSRAFWRCYNVSCRRKIEMSPRAQSRDDTPRRRTHVCEAACRPKRGVRVRGSRAAAGWPVRAAQPLRPSPSP